MAGLAMAGLTAGGSGLSHETIARARSQISFLMAITMPRTPVPEHEFLGMTI
jgi:hypothetical protein